VPKAHQSKTIIERKRIRGITDRLDAAINEHHRMRDELEALERRHPLDALRDALRRQLRRMHQRAKVRG